MINSLVVALLKESAKYKWHDLYEDPTDLPPDSEAADTWYECVHKNHEEDPYFPAYQYSEAAEDFGYWEDIFDPVSLGFVDSEFRTIEDLAYEPVVAWRYIKPFINNSDE